MLTKYADCEIISFKEVSPKEIRKTASFEHISEDRFRTEDGYLYVKVRAISSRVNKNHDGWPVNELAGMKESAFRDLQKELDKLKQLGIPVDIVFEQGTEVLGL